MPDREESTIGPVELTEPELVAWGERVGREADVPLVLALRGELGAGKSVLARAVARGAGVEANMPSPTFNLVFRYHVDARDLDVFHLDLYRLEDAEEVWELGWRELGVGRQIVLIEWPDRAEELLMADRWDISLGVPGAVSGAEGAERATGPGGRHRRGVRVVRAERHGRAPGLPGLAATE